jgi:MFS family permease
MGAAQAAVYVARPVTSYRLLGIGAGPGAVGLVTAAFAIIPLFLAIPLGRFADRTRPGPLLVVGCAVQTVACLLLGVAQSTASIAAATALLGVGHLGLALGVQHVIARESDESQHDTRFGLLTVSVSLGQLVGPLLAGALLGQRGGASLTAASGRAMFAAAGIAALATVSALVAAVGEPGGRLRARGAAAGGRARDILRISGVPAGIFASIAVLSSADVITAYLPVLGERRGIDPSVVGALLAIRAAASMAARLGIGALVRRAGRLRLIALSMAAAAAAIAAVTLTEDTVLLALLMAVAGYGLGFGQPLSMTMVVQRVPKHAAATALAVRLTGNRLGQVLAPAVAGLVAGGAGVNSVFWMLAAMLLGATAVVRRVAAEGDSGRVPAADAQTGVE